MSARDIVTRVIAAGLDPNVVTAGDIAWSDFGTPGGCADGVDSLRSQQAAETRYLPVLSGNGGPISAGYVLTMPEMRRHLESFEFVVEPGDPLRVTVPSWRVDVTIEDDLVEEVARAHGYDRIVEAPLETRGVHAERSPRDAALGRARAGLLARAQIA